MGSLLTGGFYVLLIDTLAAPELIAGAAVAMLGGFAYERAAALGFPAPGFRLRWLRGAGRHVIRIVPDLAILTSEALCALTGRRSSQGVVRATPFRCGEDPDSLGRIALTELLGSLAPNSIVLGVDPVRHLLLVHQLRRRGDARELDPMGLG